MATLHHNITGELTQELLAPGDNVRVTKISFCNVQGSFQCSIDLYLEKKLVGKYYLMKSIKIPMGSTLIHNDVTFNNSTDEFGLYIKLTKSGTETPAVDVVIS